MFRSRWQNECLFFDVANLCFESVSETICYRIIFWSKTVKLFLFTSAWSITSVNIFTSLLVEWLKGEEILKIRFWKIFGVHIVSNTRNSLSTLVYQISTAERRYRRWIRLSVWYGCFLSERFVGPSQPADISWWLIFRRHAGCPTSENCMQI